MKQNFPLNWRHLHPVFLQNPQNLLPLLRFHHQLNEPINSSHLHRSSPLNSFQRLTGPFLSLLDSRTDSLSIKIIHGLTIVHGLTQNLLLQTKLLSAYGTLRDTKHARMVFDRIPYRDLYSCKSMLKCYLMNDCSLEAIGFYECMRICMEECDNVVFSLVLKACIKMIDLDEGKKIHCHVTKVGNPDCFLLNVFIDMYAKCGDLESSMGVFDEILSKNVVSWTSVITGCNQNDHPNNGLALFNRMRLTNTEPNEHTFGSLLTSCSMIESLHQGKWIHGIVLKIGMSMNAFVATSLLDMYVKCEAITDARSFFDELDNIDLVFLTTMIVGYTQKGYPTEALKLFCNQKWASLVPNSVTIASALSASGKLESLDFGRSTHALVVKLGLKEVEAVRNSLVDMYAKCCAISEANHVFERIDHKNVVTWNAMITGYSLNKFGYEALALFNQMRSDGCLPDATSMVAALTACACLSDISIGSSFHGHALKCNFLANVYACTALLNLYNKCGDLISARRVFDDTRNRNIVTWCSMIGGYGMLGDSTGSLDLFGKMLEEEMKPNHVTFTAILTACSHSGIVGEGRKYFERMTRDHNIVPTIKHYVCMVDMLARAGKIEEALEFIEGLPVKAEVRVWAALLHGCILHSRLEIGEVAVKKMMELEPETPDYYVLMSNLYASDRRWEEANKIRDLMKKKGMVKSPASCMVETDEGFDCIAMSV